MRNFDVTTALKVGIAIAGVLGISVGAVGQKVISKQSVPNIIEITPACPKVSCPACPDVYVDKIRR